MTNYNSERSHLIQAYMILHSQQTHVRRRLSQDYSVPPTSISPASPSLSPHQSPTTSPRRASRGSVRWSSPPSRRKSSIESIPEHPEAESSALALYNDESKLVDISCKIKSTLTDLINCDGVRGDERMRTWVATRLMDVEHELKDSKRRRHSTDFAHAGARSASPRE